MSLMASQLMNTFWNEKKTKKSYYSCSHVIELLQKPKRKYDSIKIKSHVLLGSEVILKICYWSFHLRSYFSFEWKTEPESCFRMTEHRILRHFLINSSGSFFSMLAKKTPWIPTDYIAKLTTMEKSFNFPFPFQKKNEWK